MKTALIKEGEALRDNPNNGFEDFKQPLILRKCTVSCHQVCFLLLLLLFFFFNQGLLAAGSRLRCQLPAAVGELRSPRSSGGETLLHLLRVKFIFPVVCSIVFFRQSCYVKPSVPGAFLSWKITKNYLLPVVFLYVDS